MAIRVTPSRATQVSPFEMMTGRQMILALHVLYTPTIESAPEAVQTTSYLEELGRHLQSINCVIRTLKYWTVRVSCEGKAPQKEMKSPAIALASYNQSLVIIIVLSCSSCHFEKVLGRFGQHNMELETK
ncbi:hypothetical protein SKAU_G00385460 [Synaphobranchus kaupii]|uniref:Uncharacterized protein n=1 Tax=Synaphobranchus kaupii TaxID=118154 RepID=A0A9Q1EEH7_SYNKA|nr:hypothetical protein SKAU_G00385460 [Synaphobranchus kaupii]